jgi:16S rRNA (guanine966-N2)-methyltransferase
MRVIGGEFRSRRLKTAPGRSVRPTSDRLRETLFDVLGAEVAGKVFVDAYAGSGAVGIEALSRGAARAVFIENDPRAAAALAENIRSLGLERRAQILRRPVSAVLPGVAGDIVFLDPPYKQIGEYESALSLLGRSPPALVIAEHAARTPLKPAYGSLALVRTLRQGDSMLSFYRPRPGPGRTTPGGTVANKESATALADLHPKPMLVRPLVPQDRSRIVQMYQEFTPYGVAQGLPPRDAEAREKWIGRALQEEISIGAFLPGGEPAGHCFLASGQRPGEAELAVFVHQASRRRGIGSALVRAALALAQQKGIRRIWSMTSIENAAAMQLLRRSGFHIAAVSAGDVELHLELPSLSASPGN